MNQFMYLLSIIMFCGSGVALLLWLSTKREKRMLKKYEWLLLLMVVLGTPIAAAEYLALKWGAWAYTSEKTFNVRFPTEIETYLFVGGVILAVTLATLISASRIDRVQKNLKKHKKY